MKKITLLIVSFLALVFSANASVIIDETFNYSVTNLANETNNWTTTGTLTTGTGRNIETGGLVYSNSGGTYIHSALGNKINQDYSAGTNYIAYRSFTALTTGTVYLSFLYQANGDQGQTASEVMGLSYTNSNSAVKLWAGKQSDDTKNPFRIGITRSSTTGTDIVWASTTLSTSNVYLIVIKYDLSTYAASLFINPVLGTTEPTADATASSDGTARTSIGYLMFKHNGLSVAKFFASGVRVSTSWAEAVAAQSTPPQLSSPSIGAPSDATSTGFTANWTPVANAAGYDVKVYLGTNLISTTNFPGQAAATGVITGLMSGIEYTYKVIAKGDVTNYSDSDPSASSSSVTTLDPYASNALNTDLGDGTWGTIAQTQPTTGTYPSSIINGFKLTASVVYTGSVKGIKGETHTNRIAIDKSMYGGMVTLPTVNAVEQIEIHATAGSAGNGFVLKEFIPSTNTWSAIGGTYVYDANSKTAGTDSIYIISVSRSVPTKFRIENPTNGGIYIMQIITRTTNPALLAKPVTTTATSISTTAFTANWTAVANASGYKVYVYNGTTLISGAPFSVSGQSTESLAISGLADETAYTYKVQAIGDGDTNYSDSFLSFAQAVTTSTTTGLNSPNANKIEISGKSIAANTTGNFEVYSIQGIRLLSKSNTQYINTQLSSGIYVVKFTDSTGKTLLQKVNIK